MAVVERWSTSIAGGEFITQTPERIGSTFREVVGREGRTLEMNGVITDYLPHERFAVHLESERNTTDVRFTITSLPDRSRLTREVSLRLKSSLGLASILLRPLIGRSLGRESRKEFSELKRLCEQEESTSRSTQRGPV
jgi:hypothetical protein